MALLPAQEMQETLAQSLGQEDPLEEGMATHSSGFLPAESHGQRSLAGYSQWGYKELDTTEVTKHSMLGHTVEQKHQNSIAEQVSVT